MMTLIEKIRAEMIKEGNRAEDAGYDGIAKFLIDMAMEGTDEQVLYFYENVNNF